MLIQSSRSMGLRFAAVLLSIWVPQLAWSGCSMSEAKTHAAKLMRAAASYDAATVIDLTHPAVFAAGGNPAVARERLRSVYASMKAGGLAEEFGISTLDEIRFGDARIFQAGTTTSGAYLPYRGVERAHGQARTVDGWLLGVCERASGQWTFAEGRRMDAAAMRRFLPGWSGSPPLPAGAPRSR